MEMNSHQQQRYIMIAKCNELAYLVEKEGHQFKIPKPLSTSKCNAMNASELAQRSEYEIFLSCLIGKLKLILLRLHKRTCGHFLLKRSEYKRIKTIRVSLWKSFEMDSGMQKAMIQFEPALQHFPFQNDNMSTVAYCNSHGRLIWNELNIALAKRNHELETETKFRMRWLSYKESKLQIESNEQFVREVILSS